MTLRGSVKWIVINPAVRGKPNPISPAKYVRAKDPFLKNYGRGAQMVLRRRAVA